MTHQPDPPDLAGKIAQPAADLDAEGLGYVLR